MCFLPGGTSNAGWSSSPSKAGRDERERAIWNLLKRSVAVKRPVRTSLTSIGNLFAKEMRTGPMWWQRLAKATRACFLYLIHT